MVHAGLIMTIPIPNLGERGGGQLRKGVGTKKWSYQKGQGGGPDIWYA